MEKIKANDEAMEMAMARDAEKMAEVSASKVKADAYKKILDFVMASSGVPPEVLDACKIVRPSYFGITSSGNTGDGLTPAYRKLLDLTAGHPMSGDTFGEMELFEKYRFGRTEAKNWTNELIKLTILDRPRVWIKFLPTTREYTIVSIGNDIPEGWNGYVSKELTADGKARQNGEK